ncbi:MAG: hypothetical protein AB7V14_10365 [Kiritimatiellia bacterium]
MGDGIGQRRFLQGQFFLHRGEIAPLDVAVDERFQQPIQTGGNPCEVRFLTLHQASLRRLIRQNPAIHLRQHQGRRLVGNRDPPDARP